MEELVFNFPNTLVLIALLYGLIFSGILLYRNWKKKGSHFWLGVFLFVFSTELLDTYLKLIYLERIFPPIEWTYYRLLTLIPFTLWVYVSHLVKGIFKFRRFEKILLVCVALEASFRFFAFIIGAMGKTELSIFLDVVVDTWLELPIITVNLITNIKAIRLVSNYQRKLENNYSTQTEKELKWLKELLYVAIIAIVVWTIVIPVNAFALNGQLSPYWIWIVQALIIFYIGIKGHLQPEIFHEYPLVPSFEKTINHRDRQLEPVVNAFIQEDEQLIVQIERAMEDTKLFHRPKLTLQEMAQTLKASPRQLSNAINQHHQCSFSDFVNQYRVREIKERIRNNDDEQYTLLAIAFDAGFNSKSSFNAMFKKFTGQTPKQFKGEIRGKI